MQNDGRERNSRKTTSVGKCWKTRKHILAYLRYNFMVHWFHSLLQESNSDDRSQVIVSFSTVSNYLRLIKISWIMQCPLTHVVLLLLLLLLFLLALLGTVFGFVRCSRRFRILLWVFDYHTFLSVHWSKR